MIKAAVNVSSNRWVHLTGKIVYYLNLHIQLYRGDELVAIKTIPLKNRQQVLRAVRLQNRLARLQREA